MVSNLTNKVNPIQLTSLARADHVVDDNVVALDGIESTASIARSDGYAAICTKQDLVFVDSFIIWKHEEIVAANCDTSKFPGSICQRVVGRARRGSARADQKGDEEDEGSTHDDSNVMRP